MANEGDSNSELDRLRDLPLRATEIGFQPDEMIACTRCSKPNPPNRAACLYCGTEIGDSGTAIVETRELEAWENGFNVIVMDSAAADVDRVAVHVASILRMDKQDAESILAAGNLPLARLESESQAEAMVRKLEELSVKASVVSDEDLGAAEPPTRLRSISFGETDLQMELFGSGERTSVSRDDILLIVRGALFETRNEVVEKRKFRGTKPVSETDISSDEPVIDLYSRSGGSGWRIPSSGFDFSCLAENKALTVGENMKRLIVAISAFATAADIDDGYLKHRSILEVVWPSEARHDKQDLGLGRKQISKTSRTNNALQWNKYSRLRRHLYEKKV